jgi:hypothetical protein
MISLNKTMPSEGHKITRAERFFGDIRREIIRVAQFKSDSFLKKCNFKSARRVLAQAEKEFDRLMTARTRTPMEIPIHLLRDENGPLESDILSALEDAKYETIGDIMSAWPATILLCPGIDVYSHGQIFDALRYAGMLGGEKE